MHIQTVFAHVDCSDLKRSSLWYGKLLGTKPDRNPMPGLWEWQVTTSAALQLYEDKESAGKSTLTLGVPSVEAERKKLVEEGLEPGEVERATSLFLVRLRDPDNNLVVLASAHP